MEFFLTTVANAHKVFPSGVYTYAVPFFGGLAVFLFALTRSRLFRALGGLAISGISFSSVWFAATYFPTFTLQEIANYTSCLTVLAFVLSAAASVGFWKSYHDE